MSEFNTVEEMKKSMLSAGGLAPKCGCFTDTDKSVAMHENGDQLALIIKMSLVKFNICPNALPYFLAQVVSSVVLSMGAEFRSQDPMFALRLVMTPAPELITGLAEEDNASAKAFIDTFNRVFPDTSLRGNTYVIGHLVEEGIVDAGGAPQ